MTTLSWKRKLPSKVNEKTANVFQTSANDEIEEETNKVTAPKKKCILGKIEESMKFMEEGILLAEKGKYKDAIEKFDIALLVKTSHEAKIHEMKAQSYLELNELYPAIEACQKAIKVSPLWADAYQTLARTQMNFGEIKLAIRNFSMALFLRPDFDDIRCNDLPWAVDLRTKEMSMAKKEGETNKCGKCHHQIDSQGKRTENKQHVEEIR